MSSAVVRNILHRILLTAIFADFPLKILLYCLQSVDRLDRPWKCRYCGRRFETEIAARYHAAQRHSLVHPETRTGTSRVSAPAVPTVKPESRRARPKPTAPIRSRFSREAQPARRPLPATHPRRLTSSLAQPTAPNCTRRLHPGQSSGGGMAMPSIHQMAYALVRGRHVSIKDTWAYLMKSPLPEPTTASWKRFRQTWSDTRSVLGLMAVALRDECYDPSGNQPLPAAAKNWLAFYV